MFIRDDVYRSSNGYTMLNWACYYRSEEAIAFLLLKGGDPFLRTQQICETEQHEISPSAIETVLHWCSKPAYSVCCAYILAMINYHGNAVTDIGRNPDAYIVDYESTIYMTHILSLAHPKQTCQCTSANRDGYGPIDICLHKIELGIEKYKELLQLSPT